MSIHARLKQGWVISLAGTVLIFILHFPFPSYLNGKKMNLGLQIDRLVTSEFADQVYHDRTTFSEFARRPLTTGLQCVLHEAGVPFQLSFNLIVFISLFLSGIFLSKISVQLGCNASDSYWAVLAFILSYTTLFGFMGPMHTYDEPLQFVLLLSAMYFYLRSSDWLALFLFALACIARETSLLLLPFFIFIREQHRAGFWFNVLIWLTPILLFILFLTIVISPAVLQETISFNSRHRFLGWTLNFKDAGTSIVSILNLLLVVGLTVILLRRYNGLLTHQGRKMARWAEIVAGVTVVLVFIGGLAKEPRLFAPCLLLQWPLLPQVLPAAFEDVRVKARNGLVLSTAVVIGLIFSFILFQPEMGNLAYALKSYLFFYTTFTVLILFPSVTNHRS